MRSGNDQLPSSHRSDERPLPPSHPKSQIFLSHAITLISSRPPRTSSASYQKIYVLKPPRTPNTHPCKPDTRLALLNHLRVFRSWGLRCEWNRTVYFLFGKIHTSWRVLAGVVIAIPRRRKIERSKALAVLRIRERRFLDLWSGIPQPEMWRDL